VKDFFAKHELDIQSIGFVCTDATLAVCRWINLGFLHWRNRRFHTCKVLTVSFMVMRCYQIPFLLNWRKSLIFLLRPSIGLKEGALHHCLVKSLRDLGSEHTVWLFHTEVSWLSRGRIL